MKWFGVHGKGKAFERLLFRQKRLRAANIVEKLLSARWDGELEGKKKYSHWPLLLLPKKSGHVSVTEKVGER